MKEKVPYIGVRYDFSLEVYRWYKHLEKENKNAVEESKFEMCCLESLIKHINENAVTTSRATEDSVEFRGLKDIEIMALFPEGVYKIYYQTKEGEWVRNINISPYYYNRKCKSNLDAKEIIINAIRKMKL